MAKTIKNIQMKKLFIFFCSSLLIASCSKMLEEKPEDRLFSAGFYQTPTDAAAAVNAIYAPLRANDLFGFRWPVVYTAMEDYATGQGQYIAVGQYQGLPSSFVANTDLMWSGFYRTINAANIVLKYVPSISMNETQKNSLLGEARFLRAFSYFQLVRGWGAVPIKTEAVETPDGLGGKRDALNDVYAFIIEDLKFSESNLPSNQTTAGRPTSGAAKTMLADVYLTLEDWMNARIKADEVIQSAAYNLVSVTQVGDFDKIFGADVTTSVEDVFSIKFSRTLGTILPCFYHPANSANASGGFGTFYGLPSYPFLAQWDTTDLRYTYNIYTKYPNKAGVIVPNDPSRPIRFGKFKDTKAQSLQGHGNAVPVYRYADALLIYAEAASQENGGPTSLALERLNMIRRRAYGYAPAIPSPIDYSLTGQTAESFRSLVLKERAYEFLCEGKRWLDLKRTGTVKETIKAAKGIDVATAHLLFPIPKQEIDNNPDINPNDQNPGY